MSEFPGSDIDIMRDVYMTSTQRKAFANIVAAFEAAREDAERYRWLRSLDGSYAAAACVNINIGFDWIEQHGAELDDAIDQARGKGVVS